MNSLDTYAKNHISVCISWIKNSKVYVHYNDCSFQIHLYVEDPLKEIVTDFNLNEKRLCRIFPTICALHDPYAIYKVQLLEVSFCLKSHNVASQSCRHISISHNCKCSSSFCLRGKLEIEKINLRT